MTANSGGHLDIKVLEGGVNGRGCAFFLVGKLGVFVEVVVKSLLPGKIRGVVGEEICDVAGTNMVILRGNVV